jgi:dynein heavy chain
MGLMTFVNQCNEIGEKASKEYNIECMLNEMKGVWTELKFTTMSYKGSHILKGLDEI